MQGVGRAVGLQRPDLHFAEALSAVLRLAAQRLLGHEAVRTDRTGVDLVRDQVAQLEHVDVPHHDLLVELVTRPAVVERALAVGLDPLVALDLAGVLEVALDFLLVDAVEDRGRHLEAERLGRDAEVRFEHLTDVHAAGHAQRVEADFHRRAVREVRHVFLRHDPGDDALVAVAAGHLVADAELALAGDVDLHLLDDAGIDLVAAFHAVHGAFLVGVQFRELALVALDDLLDLVADRARVDVDVIVHARQLAQQRLGDLAVGRDDDLARFRVDHVERDLLAQQHVGQRLGQLVDEVFLALAVVFRHRLALALGLARRELGLGDLLAGVHLDVHDDAVGARGNRQRRVLHVRRLLAEDGAQEALFRGEFRFALGCDLAHEDVTGLNLRTHADDAVRPEVAQGFLTDVRDVPGDFLRPELGVARADLELVDVDGGINVLLDHLLGDHDGVLEVVAVPRHERDQHVAAQGQLALVSVRTVCQHVAHFDLLTLLDDGPLVDAGARVRAHELAQFIDVDAMVGVMTQTLLRIGHLTILGHDDEVRRNAGGDAITLGSDDRARIPRHLAFHAGSDKRCLADKQRHALALHVGAHQRAVGVVVLQKRD